MTWTLLHLVRSRPARFSIRAEFVAWRRTPLPARLYSAAVVLTALAVTVMAAPVALDRGNVLTVLALILVAVANGELGRLAEGGRVDRDRPHKGLSAWPFTAVLLAAPGLAGLVAAAGYGYARLRGIRFTLWKWIFSWAVVTTSAQAAWLAFALLAGDRLPAHASGRVLVGVAIGGLVFLAAEAVQFFVISRLNAASDEIGLRATLASSEFYLNELAVLCSAATAAVLWRYWPGFLLLAIPEYVLMQRAILHATLRQEARLDSKTGLLNSGTWMAAAEAAVTRAHRTGQPVAVLLIDLDHFKMVNDKYGHVAGDEVLTRTANTLTELLRAADLVGRFGGEEFCVLLAQTSTKEANQVAERIREQLARLTFTASGLQVTASVGVAAWVSGDPSQSLSDLVAAADEALYTAKRDGRNLVRMSTRTVTAALAPDVECRTLEVDAPKADLKSPTLNEVS